MLAAGGAACDYMRPDADFAVVPEARGWDGGMEEAAADNPSIRYLKKDATRSMIYKQQLISNTL